MIDIIFKKNLWMEAAVEFKRRMADISILSIVVCKFSHLQDACLIILFPVYKSSEVYLYCAVLPFGFAIGLRMESYRESFLDF